MTDIVDELRARALQGRFNLEAADEIERLRAELSEQCRLLGMSGEREAKHLAQIAALEKERDALRAKIETAENDTAHELRALAASALRVVKGWERKCGELRAKIEALERMEKQEPSREWWDSLIADISAIDCVYRGDPSYAHDAYWLRERVMQMFEQRRDALPGAKGEEK